MLRNPSTRPSGSSRGRSLHDRLSSLRVSLPSRGYATKHVVEGLEPRTLYRFRLKVTSPSGEYAYSPVVSVSTTREYSELGAHLSNGDRPAWRGRRSAFCSA